jgi:hypothetical protein
MATSNHTRISTTLTDVICGELFAALHHIASTDQQTLYDKLMTWRREQPKLDLDRRTVGCGALRLVQCHPAALPLDASHRSSLPIQEQLTVRIGPEERREVARLASRLIADEPALITNDTLDRDRGSPTDRRCFSKTKARLPCTEMHLWITAPVYWQAPATSWRSADGATPNLKPTAAMCSDLVERAAAVRCGPRLTEAHHCGAIDPDDARHLPRTAGARRPLAQFGPTEPPQAADQRDIAAGVRPGQNLRGPTPPRLLLERTRIQVDRCIARIARW